MRLRRQSAAPMGSWLLGTPDEAAQVQRIRVQALLTVPVVITNLLGILMVAVLIGVVVPGPSVWRSEFVLLNFVAVPIYCLFALFFGITSGTRRLVKDLRWATEGRTPTESDRNAAFRGPGRLTRMQAMLWVLGVVILTPLYGLVDVDVVPKVAFTIAFAGAVSCSFTYLLSEFALRPIAARALEVGGHRKLRTIGLTGRTVIAWFLGSGIPILGLMTIAIASFIRAASATNLAVSILAVGGASLVTGLLLILMSVRATAAPIRSVQEGMSKVSSGDLSASVVVYDGTELGALQTGFNRMAEGLREREQIRDLFGRHVGRDVAANALARNPELGGEECDAAVLFVDIIGSTTIAAQRSPSEVVVLLNRFFKVIVEEVDRRGGFVNKFEGDGALAVFGAPIPVEDAAGKALATARSIHARLLIDVPECGAGIGVATGRVVAGNVGANERFEYTVIGDPVNEAARLCEHSKSVPGHIVASGRALDAAGIDEGEHWTKIGETTLRGRTEPTVVMVPKP